MGAITRRGRVLRRLECAIVALGLISCGGGGGGTPTTPTPPAPTVSGVSVTGPEAAAKPGESAQFTATVTMSDGASQNVTAQSSWQSTSIAVATVNTGGTVLAVAPGEADITAAYQSVSGRLKITVIPRTANLCGVVRETGAGGLRDARVEVRDGPNAGRVTASDNGGNYCLSSLEAGNFTLRASLNAYDAVEQFVALGDNMVVDLSLRRTSPTPPPTPAPSPAPVPGPNGNQCNAAAYPSSAPCGSPSAVCNDNTLSCSNNRTGTCSTHNGVKCWLCPGRLCNGLTSTELPELHYTPVPLREPRRD
jgi:hypothetical protein